MIGAINCTPVKSKVQFALRKGVCRLRSISNVTASSLSSDNGVLDSFVAMYCTSSRLVSIENNRIGLCSSQGKEKAKELNSLILPLSLSLASSPSHCTSDRGLHINLAPLPGNCAINKRAYTGVWYITISP